MRTNTQKPSGQSEKLVPSHVWRFVQNNKNTCTVLYSVYVDTVNPNGMENNTFNGLHVDMLFIWWWPDTEW